MEVGFLHHAYLLEGESSEGWVFLDSLLDKIGFSREQNPDYHLFENESFSVDDARTIREMVANKSFGQKKVFVISSPRFSLNSQNALLKTFEEPTENTHFFVLLPLRDMLESTLLSRLEVIRLSPGQSSDSQVSEVQMFISLSPAERLVFTKKLLDKRKDDSDPRAFLQPFLDSLILALRQSNSPLQEQKRVLSLRVFASDPASMPRIVLEHLAVALK